MGIDPQSVRDVLLGSGDLDADLTACQADTLIALHAAGRKIPRAWAMKEMVRAIFAPGLSGDPSTS